MHTTPDTRQATLVMDLMRLAASFGPRATASTPDPLDRRWLVGWPAFGSALVALAGVAALLVLLAAGQ